MAYTERDLLITERTVVALQKLIAEQEARRVTLASQPDQRDELDALITQFRESLDMQNARYCEIFLSLRGREPERRTRI